MKTFAMFLMVAILLEALVEYVKTVIKMVNDKKYKTAITQGITIILGIFLAMAFHTHLFADIMSEFYGELGLDPTIDVVLTGILFSRGSNYFSDIVSKLSGSKVHLEEDGCE